MPAEVLAGGGFDAVLHFAAKSLVGESVVKPVAVLAHQRLRHPGAAGRDHRARVPTAGVLLDRGHLR